MAASLGLLVVVGVAVDVVQDDHVGGGQVDSLAPRLSRQQEHKHLRVVVEVVDEANPEMETRRGSNSGCLCGCVHTHNA